MQYNKRRRYGFLHTSKRSLSAEIFAGIIIIAFVAILGIKLNHEPNKYRAMLVPSVSSNALNTQSGIRVKPACDQETVASQNRCWIIHYSNIYDVDTEIALRIAFAESSFNPKAENYNTNGSNDLGLFQINSIHNVPDSCRLDVRCNIEWSMQKMQAVGTQPWYSSKSKWK